MSRVIPNTESALLFAGPPKQNSSGSQGSPGYSERLIKFIPAEILAGYVFVGSHVFHFKSFKGQVIFVVSLIAVCLAAIPIHYRVLRPRAKKIWKHALISCLAFLVWAYAMGGPLAVLGWHHPAIAGLIMVTFTFFAPLFKP